MMRRTVVQQYTGIIQTQLIYIDQRHGRVTEEEDLRFGRIMQGIRDTVRCTECRLVVRQVLARGLAYRTGRSTLHIRTVVLTVGIVLGIRFRQTHYDLAAVRIGLVITHDHACSTRVIQGVDEVGLHPIRHVLGLLVGVFYRVAVLVGIVERHANR